jgi:MFS family permease
MVILPELCPSHLRKYMASEIGLVIAISGALGPVLGGILTHYASWRWIFWIKYVRMLSRLSEVNQAIDA